MRIEKDDEMKWQPTPELVELNETSLIVEGSGMRSWVERASLHHSHSIPICVTLWPGDRLTS